MRAPLRAFALTAALALLALGLGGTARVAADPWPTDPGFAAPAPTLTDASAATQTPWLFTVAGEGFTPEGRVYLAVYDQMGAKLYETRWVVATAAVSKTIGGGEPGHAQNASPGGTLHEAFGNLCGATAMMRALDEGTAAWSNWLTVEPTCLTRTAR
jgi:hypothetical protein